MPSTGAISRRFWTLVSFVLITAVLSSTAAIWFTVTPFLEKQQSESLQKISEDIAQSIYDKIADNGQFLSYVASSPDIIDLVLGNSANSDATILHLDNVKGPASIRKVYIYDVLKQRLIQHGVQGSVQSSANDAKLASLANEILERIHAEGTISVRYERLGDVDRFLVGTPILNQGLVEGALIGVFYEDLSWEHKEHKINGSFKIIKAADIELIPKGMSEKVVWPVPKTDLFVAITPNRAKIQEAGEDLLRTAAMSLGLVLLLPFAIFAFYGRRALIQPHISLQESEAILRKQKKELAELAAVAEKANDSIIVTDIAGKIVWVNPYFEKLTGYSASDAIGRAPREFLQGPETDPQETAKIRDALKNFEPIQTELVNYANSGDPYWISISILPLCDDSDEPYGFMAISRDITKERQQRKDLEAAKREIEHQSLHDSLTHLPNRRALDIAIKERLNQDPYGITVVRIDLDHFKYVNDTLGHAAGDFALCQVAQIINTCIADGCLAARVGGDEFVILLSEGADRADGQRLAEKIRNLICEPMIYESRLIQIGSSFGVATSCDRLIAAEEVITAADAALYLAKDNGRNKVECYTPSVHETVIETRRVADAIREGIIREEFVPYFQPQIDAATGEVSGLETLVRWPTKSEGLLFPDQFLPVADRMSLIPDIDAIVMRKALSVMYQLNNKGLRVPKLSLNITAPRLRDPQALKTLIDTTPKWLSVSYEIIESVLLDDVSEPLQHCLDSIREAGIGIEVDDFGSGHASIVGLVQLRPDVMKIDRRLVMPILESDMSRKLLASIIDIGKSVDIKITAEGVETAEHARVLTELGCDTLQGYHFARPMSENALENYLRKRPQKLRAVG